MSVEIVVPSLGESISEVQIGAWLKAKSGPVAKDEPLVEIESEKATVELPAPASGFLTAIYKTQGELAKVGEVIGIIDHVARPADSEPQSKATSRVMPAAERLAHEAHVDVSAVQATGPGGRVLKEDVQRSVAIHQEEQTKSQAVASPPPPPPSQPTGPRGERVVRMSPIRRTIAVRLLEAQNNAALLTTFNEIDMSDVMALRKTQGDDFLKRHGVKLGFMSLFVTAAVEGLRQIPEINAEIRGEEIVYRDYCDIGIAVGGGKGLVVPVIRDAQ
ncbi:MAG: 2-oxo acid dehydrogenase subunit E2, partial [Myxococcota bacterium]|nr:2-oxo acid dehydrogenase subunit E2 [Myxococcota bacterium]